MAGVWCLHFEADPELGHFGEREHPQLGIALFIATQLQEQGSAAIEEADYYSHGVATVDLRVDRVVVQCTLSRGEAGWKLSSFPSKMSKDGRMVIAGEAEHQQFKDAVDRLVQWDPRFSKLRWEYDDHTLDDALLDDLQLDEPNSPGPYTATAG
jgi:hypothetical protein